MVCTVGDAPSQRTKRRKSEKEDDDETWVGVTEGSGPQLVKEVKALRLALKQMREEIVKGNREIVEAVGLVAYALRTGKKKMSGARSEEEVALVLDELRAESSGDGLMSEKDAMALWNL